MGEKLLRLLCIIGGAFLGYYVGDWYVKNLVVEPVESLGYLNVAGVSAAFAMMGYLVAPVLYRELQNFNAWVDVSIKKFSPQNIASGTLGIVIGLIVSNLILLPFFIKGGSYPVSIFINAVCAYLGLIVCVKLNLFPKLGTKSHEGAADGCTALPKLLDTSVIIDGRIVDIYKTNFIEGEIVVPSFVFQELRHIADSSESLRRNRGRRGLDVIAALQDAFQQKFKIYDADMDRRIEVDEQLIKVAKEINAMIITNDYNLNKQASLHGITVLNINELANAVKSVVLPGEELEIQLMKEGKEYDQGIGYLKDGTMVVVEDGRRYIGDTISVIITNMLQTPAGRVIFARPKVEGYVRS